LGDTGAAFIGAFIATCAIYFINKNYLLDAGAFKFNASIATAIGLLIIPILDTIRIFVKRVVNGKSPLMADKNHLHHMLLDLGFKHGPATTILIGTNFSFILLVIGLKNYADFIVLPAVIAVAFGLVLFLEAAHRKAIVMQENEAERKPIRQIFIKKSA
jgi:UDP-N-acetylmuramyl pentapeptide phosphotransferase/UDP-N-acetylglucosamine-1-phosphate transferase